MSHNTKLDSTMDKSHRISQFWLHTIGILEHNMILTIQHINYASNDDNYAASNANQYIIPQKWQK